MVLPLGFSGYFHAITREIWINSVVYKMYNFCYMSYVLIFMCEHAAANTLKLTSPCLG